MAKGTPDYQDADLVLRVYELRREPLMRASRDAINGKFWPANYDEVKAILATTHELNAAYRQTSTYWEMVYGLVKHGVVDAEYFMETNGEGLFLYAKVEPYIADIDLALCMTVFPGFGGQAYIPASTGRIAQVRKWIRELNPKCELEVDGGIDAKTIGEASAAGATVFVAGTAVFGTKDGPTAATRHLLELATKAAA